MYRDQVLHTLEPTQLLAGIIIAQTKKDPRQLTVKGPIVRRASGG